MIIVSPYSPISQQIIPQQALWRNRYSFEDLPSSYRKLLQSEGAGYLLNPFIPTKEPTRDSLSGILLTGLCGWQGTDDFPSLSQLNQDSFVTTLPDYLLAIYQDGAKYFCLDFSHIEPSVRLIDAEMDQWLVLAPSFSALLCLLEPYHPLLDPTITYDWTIREANQRLGAIQTGSEAQNLLEYYRDSPNKEWYITWLLHLLQSRNPEIAKEAEESLLFQLDFFWNDLQKGRGLLLIQNWLSHSASPVHSKLFSEKMKHQQP